MINTFFFLYVFEILNSIIFIYISIAVSNHRAGKSERKSRRRPINNGKINYHSTPFSVNKKKAEKAIIYKAVPLRKDNRQFV